MYGPYRCRTNLDGYSRVEWPTEFVAPPRIGERVGAAKESYFQPDGRGDWIAGRPSLRIVAITHCGDHIELELHR